MGKLTIRKLAYKGWQNCISLSNGSIELITITDVGPRIMSFGFVNQSNIFFEFEDQAGTVGGDEYKAYGGHRLWHSPEHMPRTYVPDNSPVQWEETENGIALHQDIEHWTHIRKEMIVRMSSDANEVCVRHRITNTGAWPVELAPWAVSMLAPGGVEYIPRSRKDTGLLPNQSLALWPYTRLNDQRIVLGEKYIIIKQDPSIGDPLKIGLPNPSGWGAYLNYGVLFVKRYTHHDDMPYPDFGSSYETYANKYFLESETLGPLVKLLPGASCDHVEDWSIHGNVSIPADEIEFERRILPLICK